MLEVADEVISVWGSHRAGIKLSKNSHLVGTARNRWNFEFELVDMAAKEPAAMPEGWSAGVMESWV